MVLLCDYGDAWNVALQQIAIFSFVILAFISLAQAMILHLMFWHQSLQKSWKKAKPARWHRVFWAFAITALPLILIFIGGLKTLQITSVVGSVPLIIIISVMILSFVRYLKEDENQS
jgi:BCCT family betaine/carnitine transporter